MLRAIAEELVIASGFSKGLSVWESKWLQPARRRAKQQSVVDARRIVGISKKMKRPDNCARKLNESGYIGGNSLLFWGAKIY